LKKEEFSVNITPLKLFQFVPKKEGKIVETKLSTRKFSLWGGAFFILDYAVDFLGFIGIFRFSLMETPGIFQDFFFRTD
jgi:hypothetical protein